MTTAGYSSTPLPKKLGIKPGMTVAAIGAPMDYRRLVKSLPEDTIVKARLSARRTLDCVHIFVRSKADLERLIQRAVTGIKTTGMIWVSWPKQSAGVATDLNGNVVREIGLGAGLVDIKVCAVDETWSGLKFVIPVKSR